MNELMRHRPGPGPLLPTRGRRSLAPSWRWAVHGLAVGISALTLAGCGGSGKAVPKGRGLIPDGAPPWVERGSRVQGGSIFGVGSVSGLANAPLAQDTARNRARAEIAKILEVYSASLMKDYQASVTAGDLTASDEGQAVESAIKTFSASLIEGSEQREMWLHPGSNTWFALVELDLERSRLAALASARMGRPLRRWVEENGDRVLQDLEEDLDQRRSTRQAAPPPLALAQVASLAEGPDVSGGPRPAWIDGACDRTRYLCGVGEGSDALAADTRARASLALVFEANIRTVSESFQSAAREASSRTGESWQEAERVSDHSLVSTSRIVPMSDIQERWRGTAGTTWSLATLDRAAAATSLSDRIQSLDRAVESELERARAAPSPLERIPILHRALGLLGQREALDADLRVVRLDGRGIPAAYGPRDVLALLEDSAANLRLGLALAGPGAERVRACLEEALTEVGHAIALVAVDERARRAPSLDGPHEVRIEGVITATSRGRIAGGEVVQTTLVLQLINARTGGTIRTATGSEKGTRPTVDAAAATAAFKVCQKQVPGMVRDIDRAFRR